MANDVANKIVMKGVKNLNIFHEREGGYGGKSVTTTELDFNKIIPMDESLRVSEGKIDISLYYVLSEKLKLEPKDLDLEDVKEILRNPFTNIDDVYERVKAYVEDLNDKDLKVFEDLGLKYLNNIKNFGYPNWYEWSIVNWGTKWNSYHTHFEVDNDDVVYFDTAWSAPISIIETLSKQYPNNPIIHIWADEDIAANTGKIVFLNGEVVSYSLPRNGSDEAFDNYFDLHGKSDYIQKNKDDIYCFVDDDQYSPLYTKNFYLDHLDKNDLIDLLENYDAYIMSFEGNFEDRQPVCLEEFLVNEHAEGIRYD